MNKAKQVGFSLSALLLLGAGLTACTPASSPNNNGAKTNSVRQSGIDQRNQGITGYNSTRTDGTYRTANHLATRVSQLPGVASAYVMVSGQTAFVAIHQTGGSGKGLTNGGTTGNTGTSGTTSSGGSGTTGTSSGGTTGTTSSGMSGGTGGMMNGAFGGTSNGTGTGTMGNGTGNFGETAGSWTGGNNGTRGSGTGVNGLGSYSGSGSGTGTMSGSGTNTGTTGGFSGGTGAMSGDVDNDLKQRITNTVRQADPSIKNVYVSANPELFSHFRTFTSDMTTGRFGAGTHVLGDVIHRVFPTSR